MQSHLQITFADRVWLKHDGTNWINCESDKDCWLIGSQRDRQISVIVHIFSDLFIWFFLGSHTVGVRALCFSHRFCHLCLSCIRSQKLSKISAKFCRLHRKLGLPSKNMMSYFAPEVAKYSKRSPKPKIVQNSVRACCLAALAMQLVSYCQHSTHWKQYLNLTFKICRSSLALVGHSVSEYT